MKNNEKETRQIPEDLVIGRNAVLEALNSDRTVDAVYVARGERSGSVSTILRVAREKQAIIKEVDVKKLDYMCFGANHQGVAAKCAVKEYSSVDDIFALAEERGENPFIIICDELEDPHNLGAIIRTAEIAGAHGVIIPKRRSVSLSFAVGKTSAGAIEYVPVARVGNLASEIDALKERGVWVYGADMKGESWCGVDYSGSVALVVGSEGKGISRLIKEKCDFLVTLPMKGKITSLNASVAAGVMMMEISRQRSGIKAR